MLASPDTISLSPTEEERLWLNTASYDCVDQTGREDLTTPPGALHQHVAEEDPWGPPPQPPFAPACNADVEAEHAARWSPGVKEAIETYFHPRMPDLEDQPRWMSDHGNLKISHLQMMENIMSTTDYNFCVDLEAQQRQYRKNGWPFRYFNHTGKRDARMAIDPFTGATAVAVPAKKRRMQ